MKAMSHLFASSFAVAVVLLSAGVSAVQGQSLDYQSYNAILFNNLNTTGGIDGRTLVGNDFTGTNSANLGIHLNNSVGAGDRSFVVGNNVVGGNPLNLQRGSLYVDGSTNGRTVNFNGGGTLVVDHGIDAAVAEIRGYSIAQSQSLNSLGADSTVTLPTGGQSGPTKFMATGGADGLAVFHVSAADIFANPLGQQFELITDFDTTDVLINVSGSAVDWINGNMVGNFTSDYWQGHTLWNFSDATSINLGSHNFNGGILAPYASITTAGNIDGLVVADNLTTTGEVHLPNSNSANALAYEGHLAPVPVPEPGTVVFLIAAGGLLFIVRNRRLVV